MDLSTIAPSAMRKPAGVPGSLVADAAARSAAHVVRLADVHQAIPDVPLAVVGLSTLLLLALLLRDVADRPTVRIASFLVVALIRGARDRVGELVIQKIGHDVLPVDGAAMAPSPTSPAEF